MIKTHLACPAFCALSMKSLNKGPSPFCLCFSIAEDLFYCTFSGVTLWPPGFAIVNVYKWKLGVFQVRRVCQTRVAWIGAPGHGWEMLQHLCQPPGTVAEALLPDACYWCQQWDWPHFKGAFGKSPSLSKSSPVLKVGGIHTCKQLPRVWISVSDLMVALWYSLQFPWCNSMSRHGADNILQPWQGSLF